MSRYVAQPMKGSRGFASGVLALVVLFLVSAAGVTWVAMGIIASDRWPIRWLELNGEFQRVSAEQLRATLSPEMNSNFFTVDLGALEEAASRISWVSTVDVKKTWPDTVTVEIDEFEPVALRYKRFRVFGRIDEPAVALDNQVRIPFLEVRDQAGEGHAGPYRFLESVYGDAYLFIHGVQTPCRLCSAGFFRWPFP